MAKIVGILPVAVTMQNVNVVSVTYRSQAMINRFMKSLGVTPKNNFLTVVDNNSDDGTVALLKQYLPAKQLIINAQNVGYATAANQGATNDHKRFITFINPDCFVQTSAIEALCNYLNQHPEAGIVGCRVVNEDLSLQAASCRRLPSFWRIVWHQTGLYRLGLPGINKPLASAQEGGQVEAVNGAFFVMRRRIFDLLNGFDEQFKLHFEDLDLFARCAEVGYQVHYRPEITAIHLKGRSAEDNNRLKNWKRQGLKRYFQKHRPAWEQWLITRLVSSK